MAVNLRRRVKLPDARLTDAILSLQPTAYWPLDDGSSPLRDVAGGWHASVTGSPGRVAAPDPIGSGWAFSGSGQHATSSGSIPQATTAVTVFCVFRSDGSTAVEHRIFARKAASQHAWGLSFAVTTGAFDFAVFQSGGAVHCSASIAGTWNNNVWRSGAGIFDGTTLTTYLTGATPASSTSLTGTWYTASTQGVSVANVVNPADAVIAHAAYWTRALTLADIRWLDAIAMGG